MRIISNKTNFFSIRKETAFNTFFDHLIFYPTPSNLNYFWGFGSLAGLCLVFQIMSGVFLAMFYTPQVDLAFSSIESISRNVSNGWFYRYFHANGASFFFMVVYVHIARGVYYKSYISPRGPLWLSGLTIFLVMMATAFLGYVLPWGQMSFWGATVITNLFTAIPFIGQDIAYWVWGGFAVDNATLNRFFSLHFTLPFILIGLIFLHLFFLHVVGSNNPIVRNSSPDQIFFFPLFFLKDLFGLLVFLTIYTIFVFYMPNYLGHPDNYIKANPLVTPTHIVPEWYFLPFYAILRAIPSKALGVLAMGGSIVILGVLGFLKAPHIGPDICIIHKTVSWIFFFNFVFLGWLGGCSVDPIFTLAGQISSIIYVLCILIFCHENLIYRKYLNSIQF